MAGAYEAGGVMPDAVAVGIHKAVTAMIQTAATAGELSEEFTLERSYAEWDLELTQTDNIELRDSDKLRVDVVLHTAGQNAKLSSRTTLQYGVPIDIAVRRKFGTDKQGEDTGRINVEEIDRLMLLVQQLHVMFTAQRLADANLAVWDGENGGTKILVAPHRDLLRLNRQFTGIIRITFRADVALA